MIIFITNPYHYHNEIVLTIIENYDKILPIKKSKEDIIFFNYGNDDSFLEYAKTYYPFVNYGITKKYDYYILCTFYPDERYNRYYINDKKHFYISHEYKEEFDNPNIYYLTPLCKSNKYLYCDVLPYQNEKIKSDIPIYIIQGEMSMKRRNFDLLEKILEETKSLEYKIKIIGKGKLNEKFNKYSDKIITKSWLTFIDYHKEFLDGYCILPLTLKKTQPQYYKNKLTSTINYGLAYNLKFLIDNDLQHIYNLNNVEVFNNENDIVVAFKKTYYDFYANKQIVCILWVLLLLDCQLLGKRHCA